eukprot:3652984-Pyramimonas_sp.AAC.1
MLPEAQHPRSPPHNEYEFQKCRGHIEFAKLAPKLEKGNRIIEYTEAFGGHIGLRSRRSCPRTVHGTPPPIRPPVPTLHFLQEST